MNKTNNMNGTSQNSRNATGIAPNGNMTQNGSNMSGGVSPDLVKAIHELEFVRVELELYLDTHPGCKVALDYYHRTVDALRELRERYQAGGDLLFAEGSTNTEWWDWVGGMWPWFKGDEIMMRNERDKGK